MAGLGDLITSLKEPPKEGTKKSDRKYVQWSLTEWSGMEASAGRPLKAEDIKALVSSIFAGKVNLVRPKA